jgi:FkbM family methyltransferase
MGALKRFLASVGESFGTEILGRLPTEVGQSALSDMKRLVPAQAQPLILDVGANTGQSVKRFRKLFPRSVIHSFEPSQRIFNQLKANIADKRDVYAWNIGVGSSVGKRIFLENVHSDMSSFLELSKCGWGKIEQENTVEVTTVDAFLGEQRIESVDILKSDTQGYDFEVIKGAEQSMRQNRIGLVYFEFIFSEMYKNLPRFDEVYRHLTDRNYLLVSIYEMRHQNNLASWADALFVNKEYYGRKA